MEKENPRGEKEDQVTRPLWRVFCCQDWKRFHLEILGAPTLTHEAYLPEVRASWSLYQRELPSELVRPLSAFGVLFRYLRLRASPSPVDRVGV